MNDYNNDENKGIIKLSVLGGMLCIVFLLLAFMFMQLGNTYSMQSAFATAEPAQTESATQEATSTPDTDDSDIDETDETATPSDESVSPAPDTSGTSEPGNTGGENPEDTENPESPGRSDTSSPESKTPGESGATGTPDITGTEIPDTSLTPTIVTPSPTLAGIEEPIVSGNIVVDVEDEKNEANSALPSQTFSPDDEADPELIAPTQTPISAVDDKGSLSEFFKVLMYVFIVCAVLTAGYGVYLTVKYVKNKKKGNKK